MAGLVDFYEINHIILCGLVGSSRVFVPTTLIKVAVYSWFDFISLLYRV